MLQLLEGRQDSWNVTSEKIGQRFEFRALRIPKNAVHRFEELEFVANEMRTGRGLDLTELGPGRDIRRTEEAGPDRYGKNIDNPS
jgi:hypothetical protein